MWGFRQICLWKAQKQNCWRKSMSTVMLACMSLFLLSGTNMPLEKSGEIHTAQIWIFFVWKSLFNALCGYHLVKFPVENFFPSPPFSWDPIISDRIFGNCLLPSFTFDIYFLRTSQIWSTRDGEFATESIAIQIGWRKDVKFFGDELNVKS